jgi:hypothetical protein
MSLGRDYFGNLHKDICIFDATYVFHGDIHYFC